jgi:hypothetical protein
MTIAKKPSPRAKENAAKKFIQSDNGQAASTTKRDLKNVIIAFDMPLLERLDKTAKEMGLSRTGLVNVAVVEKMRRWEMGS